MKHTTALTRDLAHALGVPNNARKAVLTLEVGTTPRLDIELLPEVRPETRTSACDAAAVARLPFILRLWLQDTRTFGGYQPVSGEGPVDPPPKKP